MIRRPTHRYHIFQSVINNIEKGRGEKASTQCMIAFLQLLIVGVFEWEEKTSKSQP